jgi:hypothetical protein
VVEQRSVGIPEGIPQGSGSDRSTRLQILSTEHWSLLATRSLSWSESFSRTSMYLSTLTGSVVALALVGQAMPGQGFVLFALVLLPVVLFLGVATYARLVAINVEDIHWVVGMNRIRNAYIKMAPDLEDYFISGVYDDAESVMKTFAAFTGGQFLHGFVTTPGMLAVINGVVGGVLAGLVAGVLGFEMTVAIVAGATVFVLVIAGLSFYQLRSWEHYEKRTKPLFPRPGATE